MADDADVDATGPSEEVDEATPLDATGESLQQQMGEREDVYVRERKKGILIDC